MTTEKIIVVLVFVVFCLGSFYLIKRAEKEIKKTTNDNKNK